MRWRPSSTARAGDRGRWSGAVFGEIGFNFLLEFFVKSYPTTDLFPGKVLENVADRDDGSNRHVDLLFQGVDRAYTSGSLLLPTTIKNIRESKSLRKFPVLVPQIIIKEIAAHAPKRFG